LRGSRKLRLAPLWPALAGLVVMAASLAWLLPPLFERSVGEQLLDSLRLVEEVVAGELARPAAGDGAEPRPRRELQRLVTGLAQDTSLRLTVIAPGGRVLADSDRSWQQLLTMDNHNRRPEVEQARRRGTGRSTRDSDTTGRRYVYAAAGFRPTAVGASSATSAGSDAGSDVGSGTGSGAGSNSGDVYVLRLAQPLDDLRDMLRRLLQAAALALLTTAAVIALLSVWLDRRLLQPLEALIDGAGSLATGRHPGQRLPVPQQRDLAELAVAINQMTERVEEQIAAVEKERDYLSTILSSMTEGVLVVDGGGRAVLTNPAFRRLFDLPREMAGRLPLEISRHPELAAVIERTLETGSARIDEMVLDSTAVEGGAQTRTVFLAGSALRRNGRADHGRAGHGAGGDEPGAVVVARDTTEATRLTQVRRDFVANVSHELRTPLSAIRGYAETLRDGALDDPAAAGRFTGRILEQCHRLQALLDDLLVLSRLESVEIPLESRPVDLAALGERSLETMSAAARERETSLVHALPEGGLPPFTGDRGAIERLLLNLLENAIKYNRPGGEVRLAMRLAEGADGGREAVIEVSDTGLGIPADSLPRIFERFYRVDKGRARDEGGTGLGLAIVKHVAQTHGGRVEVESRHGTGSVFRVHLPLGGTPGGGEEGPGDEKAGVWRRE